MNEYAVINHPDYYDNFYDYLEGINRKYMDKRALTWYTRKGEEMWCTYHDVYNYAVNVRTRLLKDGMAGKHIALVGENSLGWIVTYLAIASCGGTVICIDTEQPDESLINSINRADSVAVFASESYIDIFDHLAAESDTVEKIYEMNLYKEPCTQVAPAFEKPEADRTASIVFTSGTTARSKMVMLSQKAILHNVANSFVYVDAYDRVFSALPFYHAYGMTCSVLATLVRGAELVFNGNLKTMLRDIMISKPESMLTVPLVVEGMYNALKRQVEEKIQSQNPREKKGLFERFFAKSTDTVTEQMLIGAWKQTFPNLKVIICGGAHLGRDIQEIFLGFGVKILHGYGITECAPIISANGNKIHRVGTIGIPIPGCEIRFDEEEILVKSVSLMTGYYKDEEATKAVLQDGWFRTGDLGEMDKDGYLHITGRKKNLIVFKNGKKISPETLEEAIREIPIVKEVVVYGASNGTSADDVRVYASIFPDPELCKGKNNYEILEYLNQEIRTINNGLPLYQQIQSVNIRDEEFKKNSARKIKRYLVD